MLKASTVANRAAMARDTAVFRSFILSSDKIFPSVMFFVCTD